MNIYLVQINVCMCYVMIGQETSYGAILMNSARNLVAALLIKMMTFPH